MKEKKKQVYWVIYNEKVYHYQKLNGGSGQISIVNKEGGASPKVTSCRGFFSNEKREQRPHKKSLNDFLDWKGQGETTSADDHLEGAQPATGEVEAVEGGIEEEWGGGG
jgi:hypothetical protein